MSAHIIVHIDVENPADLTPYQDLAKPTMAAHGIEVVAKSPAVEALEGEAPSRMTVLLRAESPEAARRWYGSAAYLEAVQAREGVARFTTLLL